MMPSLAVLLLGLSQAPEAPIRLRLEYMKSPVLGIDTPYPPRLSWSLQHGQRGQRQVYEHIPRVWPLREMGGRVGCQYLI